YAPIPAIDEWPLSRFATAPMPAAKTSTFLGPQSRPVVAPRNPLDRLQLPTWAMLRGQQGMVAGTPSLASGGTLGEARRERASPTISTGSSPRPSARLRTSG